MNVKALAKTYLHGEVVVAQLVEQLLPTLDICGSNPVIGHFYLPSAVLKMCWKDENEEKESGNGPI